MTSYSWSSVPRFTIRTEGGPATVIDNGTGKPVNLGYITPSGEIWTEASYWRVDEDLAQDYNVRLAQLFGGKVRRGRPNKDGLSGPSRSLVRRLP